MKTTTLRAGTAGALAIAVLAGLGVGSPSTAKPTESVTPAADRSGAEPARATLTGAQLSDKVARLARAGRTATQIDRALARHGFHVQDAKAYDARARAVSARDSTRGDMRVSAPFIVHDEGARWYWMANYRWTSNDFSDDQTASCRFYDRCKLPGRDAFGLYFDRRQDIRGYWASFGHRSPSLPAARVLSPWERNRFGVVFRRQDIVYRNSSPDDLNMYYGNVTVEIDGRPCGDSTAWSKYAHTWGNKGLPDVTINAGFLGFTFSGSGHKWQKVSQPGANKRRC
jgi:hypothetical protein